jgi:hypothetical protein
MKYLRDVRRLKSLIGEAAGLEPSGRWQAFGTDIAGPVLRRESARENGEWAVTAGSAPAR